jgi:hypothetical protein
MQEINYRDLVEGENYFVELREPLNKNVQKFKAFGFEKMRVYEPEADDFDDYDYLYAITNNSKHIKAIQSAVSNPIIRENGEDTYLWLPRVEFVFTRIVTAKSSRLLNNFDFVDRDDDDTTFENVFPYFINDLATWGKSVKFYLTGNVEDRFRQNIDMHILKYVHDSKSSRIKSKGRRRRTKNKPHRKKRTRKYKKY